VCFAVGIYLARQGKGVIVLNESEELTFRDYKIANGICEGLGVDVMLASRESTALGKPGTLCYCSTKSLLLILGDNKTQSLKSSVTIIDEFDSFIFERDPDVAKKIQITLN
jgi:hypothetical protein